MLRKTLNIKMNSSKKQLFFASGKWETKRPKVPRVSRDPRGRRKSEILLRLL
jgi:hypothetical protein